MNSTSPNSILVGRPSQEEDETFISLASLDTLEKLADENFVYKTFFLMNSDEAERTLGQANTRCKDSGKSTFITEFVFVRGGKLISIIRDEAFDPDIKVYERHICNENQRFAKDSKAVGYLSRSVY